MKAMRFLAAVLLVCALTWVAACGDRVSTATAPAAPNAGLIGDLLQPTGLLQCSALPADVETRTIGPSGGTIQVGPHTLTIPPRALSQSVTITAEVGPPGKGTNTVHFEPEGLVFARPASLTMSYANCKLLGNLLPKRIAYVSNKLDVLYYLLSIDNLLSRKVTGQVDHFSDYAVAW
jgi:hypothetical protein